jgi:integrase
MTKLARLTAVPAEPSPHLAPTGLDAAAVEAAYAADHWDANLLGVPALRGRASASFAGIAQPWLREAVKSWCRLRLATGNTFATVSASTLALSRFSGFLAARNPHAGPHEIDREALEGYMSWLIGRRLAASSRSLSLVCLRSFLDHNRRHGWLRGIPATAAIYNDDLPKPDKPLPRFVSEFVMAQLENDTNLERLDPTTRNLLVVIMETGLRAGDTTLLPFDPLVDDSVGWPCLRYRASKVNAEQLVPLSAKAAAAIRAQQSEVSRRWPNRSPWLFPATEHNPTGSQPVSYGWFRTHLNSWENTIGLHDDTGRPVRVTAHQFRHTLGTRLINADVPQHIVQRVLGHASPRMTAVYAQLHDTTVREAYERYCQGRVDIAGQVLGFDSQAPTAAAEWVKHNLGRVQASLPNGYCGRPPQQDCPHPNACLTCPDFQTTVDFLDIHRRQADATTVLLAAAEANGHQRLAANHRQVQENLQRIIPALETLQNADKATRHDQP